MLIAFFTSFANQGTIILVPDTLGLDGDPQYLLRARLRMGCAVKPALPK